MISTLKFIIRFKFNSLSHVSKVKSFYLNLLLTKINFMKYAPFGFTNKITLCKNKSITVLFSQIPIFQICTIAKMVTSSLCKKKKNNNNVMVSFTPC